LEAAKSSKILAKNQGLYNGFLAAGLIWAIVNKNNFEALAIFSLSCVVVAGIFGAYSTKNIKLFYVQALPALIGLLLVLFGN
jgi:putative membrane protein